MKGLCGPGWEKGTGRLCDPRAKARAVNCWSSKMWWSGGLFSPGSGWGRGGELLRQ